MYAYDNSAAKKKLNAVTFSIDVDAVDILYTYIRKNACTSFKHLFKSCSPYDFHQSGSDLKGMAEYYLVKNKKEAALVDKRIFIYRDPVDRVVSVFKNKFIQQSGAEDILQDFCKLTGLSPEECTFEMLVSAYVSKISKGGRVDAHLLPQQWHLLPIQYNTVIPLDRVQEGMSNVLGANVAKKFFSKPVNSTVGSMSVDSREYWRVPVKELRELYAKHKVFPSKSSLVNNDIYDLLVDIYKDDYMMIREIERKENYI